MVPVLHLALQHIGHCFKSAMWMGWKASDVVSSVRATEFIKHEKRVKTVQISAAKHPFSPHSSISSCLLSAQNFLHFSLFLGHLSRSLFPAPFSS